MHARWRSAGDLFPYAHFQVRFRERAAGACNPAAPLHVLGRAPLKWLQKQGSGVTCVKRCRCKPTQCCDWRPRRGGETHARRAVMAASAALLLRSHKKNVLSRANADRVWERISGCSSEHGNCCCSTKFEPSVGDVLRALLGRGSACRGS